VNDFLFNLLLVPVDVAVVLLAARAKKVPNAVRWVLWGMLAAVLAAMLVQQGTFHLFRLQSYVLFGHAPLVLICTAWALRRRSRGLALVGLLLALSSWAVALDAFVVEPRRLDVSTVQLHSSKVSRPLRIGVVADLQTDRIGKHERRALERALRAAPDLLLLTGDYLHAPASDHRRLGGELRALLDELDFRAPLGAYAVRGNTELNAWPELFAGTEVTPWLETATLDVGEIALTGLDLWDSFDRTLLLEPADRFHVVFGHAPDFALGLSGADLLIAGHTHGGQVRLPIIGPLLTFSRVPRAWASGVTELPGGGTLVVSRGVGMERGRAPRMRFLCPPEIVIIDVLPGS
jgi:predicted MPP superfamily phosphohydrolase